MQPVVLKELGTQNATLAKKRQTSGSAGFFICLPIMLIYGPMKRQDLELAELVKILIRIKFKTFFTC